MWRGDCQSEHANRAIFFALLLINLREVIAYFAVLVQQPGCANEILRFCVVTFLKVDPAKRVPISAHARDCIQVVERKIRKLHVAQSGGGGGDSGFGVFERFVEFE